ncbi:DUF2878 domain-containing protein [Teredinibacter sp. KSP-S5-2]|uniref:DUF2878 domain-containing protein n=1 Tax=Teredinibacter sp. KSP-S5-2 TaxID=3034506 RepID=UPI00293527CC|nr:DUF2878 domain-containing protein [Teredinibacter sp. KSP-S5-2]WNO11247.1 DUF2878 domain-containing protein [Teredinibacter sp. KSP-S5-2]
MTTKFWIINLILFQLAWFTCALLTPQAKWLLPVYLILHFVLSPQKRIDTLILPIAVAGISLDYVFMQMGFIEFGNQSFPIWLVLLWGLFTLTLNHSLAWLQRLNTLLVAPIGAIGGASSYLAALKFQALTSQLTTVSFTLLYGLTWALLLPLMIWLIRRFVLPQNMTQQI